MNIIFNVIAMCTTEQVVLMMVPDPRHGIDIPFRFSVIQRNGRGKLLPQFSTRSSNVQLLVNHRWPSDNQPCKLPIEYSLLTFKTHKSPTKIKYFKELKILLRRMGIFYWDSGPRAKMIAITTRSGLLVTYISYFLTPAWCLLFEAQRVGERSAGLFCIFGALLMISWYSVFLLKSTKYGALLLFPTYSGCFTFSCQPYYLFSTTSHPDSQASHSSKLFLLRKFPLHESHIF